MWPQDRQTHLVPSSACRVIFPWVRQSSLYSSMAAPTIFENHVHGIGGHVRHRQGMYPAAAHCWAYLQPSGFVPLTAATASVVFKRSSFAFSSEISLNGFSIFYPAKKTMIYVPRTCRISSSACSNFSMAALAWLRRMKTPFPRWAQY